MMAVSIEVKELGEAVVRGNECDIFSLLSKKSVR
jgi:hypothetical protein